MHVLCVVLKVILHLTSAAVSISTWLEASEPRIGAWIGGRFNRILPCSQPPDRLYGPAQLRCS
jgi:hypothetical protein